MSNTTMETNLSAKKSLTKSELFFLADRFNDAGDKSKMIPIEELDYYLDELEKMAD